MSAPVRLADLISAILCELVDRDRDPAGVRRLLAGVKDAPDVRHTPASSLSWPSVDRSGAGHP